MKYIERQQYLNRIIGLRGKPDIKIITGIRRAGKSELLRAYKKYLNNFVDINIIFVDYADLLFDDIKEYKKLYKYVEDRYIENKENIVMIDEVQLCPEFELAVNSLHNSGKYDLYITGSNAFLLSSDLATLFTGRFVEIHVFPFSFKEYCEYFEIDGREIDALENYLIAGGLSGSYIYNGTVDAKNYIYNVYETIEKRDLVDKYNITELSVLDSLSEFLMDNISNLTTTNNISNLLKLNSIDTNHVTIGNYLKYLCNAYLFYKVKRYDIKGKKYLETSDKYYLSDLGIRYSVLGERNMDYGRAYENVIALELLRRGYDIYVGKLYQKEIDFVAIKQSEKIYIQVSDNIRDAATLERELAPLRSIKDAYPKILIANTRHPQYDVEGIQIYDIARWLLESEKSIESF